MNHGVRALWSKVYVPLAAVIAVNIMIYLAFCDRLSDAIVVNYDPSFVGNYDPLFVEKLGPLFVGNVVLFVVDYDLSFVVNYNI